jgi:endonuclease/exonuclease/phosphatase family metal-dependent hydrolase
MKRFTYALTLLFASLLGFAGSALSSEIDVMTQNQYIGADLLRLFETGDFNTAVIDTLQIRAASRPADRVKALAKLIKQRGPALVGLQEVSELTCFDYAPQGMGCEDPSIAGAFTDHLADTLDALGERYVKAAEVVNINLPAGLGLDPPFDELPGIPIDLADDTRIFISVVDRDVILARSDVDYEVIDFTALQPWNSLLCTYPSADGCNYAKAASADVSLAIPGIPFPIPVSIYFERGFVGVNATLNGESFRFVTTHLETRLESAGPTGRFVQTAQALELKATLQVLDAVDPGRTTLVVGDFNSDPRDLEEIPGLTPPYQIFVEDYTDAWTLRPGTATGKGPPLLGYTCCQDEDLANRRSNLYERIDLIFSLMPPKQVKNARLLGDSIASKTRPPELRLWPSDHASVAARLGY